MKLIYLKPALKCNSYDVAIGIKIPFFRVLVTIEPGRSLLQFVTTNCLIQWIDFNELSLDGGAKVKFFRLHTHISVPFRTFWCDQETFLLYPNLA